MTVVNETSFGNVFSFGRMHGTAFMRANIFHSHHHLQLLHRSRGTISPGRHWNAISTLVPPSKMNPLLNWIDLCRIFCSLPHMELGRTHGLSGVGICVFKSCCKNMSDILFHAYPLPVFFNSDYLKYFPFRTRMTLWIRKKF